MFFAHVYLCIGMDFVRVKLIIELGPSVFTPFMVITLTKHFVTLA